MTGITDLYRILTSLGKGEVSGSSPDEGMAKSIAAKEVIRNKVRLTYSQISYSNSFELFTSLILANSFSKDYLLFINLLINNLFFQFSIIFLEFRYI